MPTLITGPLDTLPVAPDPATDTPTSFSTKAAAMVLAIKTMVTQLITIISQINTVIGEVNTNTTTASNAAIAAAASAAAAISAANTTGWVSGTYSAGATVWSPITFRTYRRTSTSPGASAADPSTAPTLWVDLTPGDLIPQRISGSQTLAVGVAHTIYGNGTYTLPAIAGNGSRIGICVLAGVTAAIIAPAGADKIRGVAGSMTVDNAPFDAIIRDTGATDGWV